LPEGKLERKSFSRVCRENSGNADSTIPAIALPRNGIFGHSCGAMLKWFCLGLIALAGVARAATNDVLLPPLPAGARLALEEDWSSGAIDPARWYALRKMWGRGNNGVVPENVRVGRDVVAGQSKNVLVCTAHGDLYDGDVVGYDGGRTRVGGVLVSKGWFASGRFEVWMKVNGVHETGSFEPPRGTVPAIWTYGYRSVRVAEADKDCFVASIPLYNPHLKAYGAGLNEYWSEVDFPELGKNGDFTHGLYNTYCQSQYDWQTFALPPVADGQYHCFTTEWRTTLKPLPGITDTQVTQYAGFWWIRDASVPFTSYLGNPLKRLGPDRYSVCAGESAQHWIDGRKVGANTRNVPSMTAQLNIGIWLPPWAGPAPWKTASVSFASIKIWQYDDAGDVRGILVDDLNSNFDAKGKPK
jgi:hypothetical protein